MRSLFIASLLVLPCACSAATLRPVPGDRAQPVEFASLELPASIASEADSASLAENTSATADMELPEAPESVESFVAATTPQHPQQERLTVEKPEFPSANVNLLYSLPVVGTVAVRMGAQNFNTDDGSSLDAFAICYRLNGRTSVQVVPGDPAPVKIPVTTMANNMGVTVGMVYRLSRRP